MSTQSIPWFPLYPRDLLVGLSEMTANAQHIFFLILIMIYENNGPIPLQTERLARRAKRSDEETADAVEELRRIGKIAISAENLISNARADIEIAIRREKWVEKSEKGKAAVKAKHAKQSLKDKAARISPPAALPEQARGLPDVPDTSAGGYPDLPAFLDRQKQIQKSSENIKGFSAEDRAVPNVEVHARTQLPADFVLTEERQAAASKLGLSHRDDIREEFENFTNWYRGRGVEAADWDAMWKSWIPTAIRKKREKSGRPHRPFI